jgi:MtN3 and saliva related transmembrane protein
MTAMTVGLLAGTLTSIASIPQLARTLRTRHVRDISIWQPLFLSVGVGLWMLYGFLIKDLPLVLANIIPFICNVWLSILKIYYKDNDGCVEL